MEQFGISVQWERRVKKLQYDILPGLALSFASFIRFMARFTFSIGALGTFGSIYKGTRSIGYQ